MKNKTMKRILIEVPIIVTVDAPYDKYSSEPEQADLAQGILDCVEVNLYRDLLDDGVAIDDISYLPNEVKDVHDYDDTE